LWSLHSVSAARSCVLILSGLYCSVNRQDMKLDRVSVFC
jgi:hypothetical protein